MSLDELFEDAFAVTCGVSRASVLASDRYREILGKYWEGSRYLRLMSVGDDSWGDIYEAPVTAELLAEPLTLEKDKRNKNRVLTEVHQLGEHAIQVADTMLTPQCLRLADRFRSARLSAKVAMLPQICSLLNRLAHRNSNRKRLDSEPLDEGEKAARELSKKNHHLWNYMYQPVEAFSPIAFRTPGVTPNCLGFSQILAAFFRRTGMPFFLAAPVRFVGVLGTSLATELGVKAVRAAIDNDLASTRGYANALGTRLTLGLAYKQLWETNFHAAVIVKLAPERWVLVDPYLSVWGRIPSGNEELDELEQALHSMQFVLPGLSLDFSMGPKVVNRYRRIEAMAKRRLERAVKLAIELRETLRGEKQDMDRPIERVIRSSRAFIPLVRSLGMKESQVRFRDPLDVAAQFFYGENKVPDSEQVLRRRYDEILCRLPMAAARHAAHAVARAARGKGLFHPRLEISVPTYGLGIRILNDFAMARGESVETHAFMNLLWAGQASLANRIGICGDQEAMEEALKIRILHPALERWVVKLRGLAAKEPEGEDDGAEP